VGEGGPNRLQGAGEVDGNELIEGVVAQVGERAERNDAGGIDHAVESAQGGSGVAHYGGGAVGLPEIDGDGRDVAAEAGSSLPQARLVASGEQDGGIPRAEFTSDTTPEFSGTAKNEDTVVVQID
jgi:hypothetical protein